SIKDVNSLIHTDIARIIFFLVPKEVPSFHQGVIIDRLLEGQSKKTAVRYTYMLTYIHPIWYFNHF
ncbi:hypothetical protein ACJX0J_023635, partial [Zea mays]